jgi:hypothetical protein
MTQNFPSMSLQTTKLYRFNRLREAMKRAQLNVRNTKNKHYQNVIVATSSNIFPLQQRMLDFNLTRA